MPKPHFNNQSTVRQRPFRLQRQKKKSVVDRAKFAGNTESADRPQSTQEAVQTRVPIRKPGKNFFRVCTDPQARILGVDTIDKGFGEIRVLTQSVTRTPDLADHIKRVDLVLCVDHKGDIFVWPISRGSESWYASSWEMAELATRSWIKIIPYNRDSSYRKVVATPQKYPETSQKVPVFSLEGLAPSELLDLALSKNAIESDDDPALIALIPR